MAEETSKPEVVVPETEKPVAVDEKVPETEAEFPKEVVEKESEKEVAVEKDAEKEVAVVEKEVAEKETNVVSELPQTQRKALEDLKKLIQEALAKREFATPPPPPPVKEEKTKEEKKVKAVEEKKAEEEEEENKEEVVEEKKAEEEVVEEKKEETPVVVVSEGEKAEAEAEKEEEKEKEEGVETQAAATTTTEEPESTTTEVPVAAEEPAKAEETPVTEEAPKAEEEEKTVEAIKETIVEEVVTATSTETPTEEPTKEVGVEAEAEAEAVPDSKPVEPEEVSIWGIPLLADERSDVVLLKFLRARDFKVKEAFTMIRNTVRWRKEFGVDELLEEDLGNDYDKVLFTHGYDKEGRIVCYNVLGEFQNKELYQNTFADGVKGKKFLKSLIQFLEKIIRDLDFSPKGINSIVLVNDLKNAPGYGKSDVSKIIGKVLVILQDNYPEFVAKQLCINASWWHVAYCWIAWIYLTVISPRTKSKFEFASPSKTPETLFKYIAPEHVPIQYGGHSKIGENEFSPADTVTEVTIKPGSKHPIEFSLSEATELVWELRVIGWDVNYGAEFFPEKEGGYTLNIAKPKKVLSSTNEPVISDTFKLTESGKVVITIDNQSSKKKKLLYRSKVKTSE